jgi:hypothetical protein
METEHTDQETKTRRTNLLGSFFVYCILWAAGIFSAHQPPKAECGLAGIAFIIIPAGAFIFSWIILYLFYSDASGLARKDYRISMLLTFVPIPFALIDIFT